MWTGWMDGVGDTPQTVMTTRAPAVLKRVAEQGEFHQKRQKRLAELSLNGTQKAVATAKRGV